MTKAVALLAVLVSACGGGAGAAVYEADCATTCGSTAFETAEVEVGEDRLVVIVGDVLVVDEGPVKTCADGVCEYSVSGFQVVATVADTEFTFTSASALVGDDGCFSAIVEYTACFDDGAGWQCVDGSPLEYRAEGHPRCL